MDLDVDSGVFRNSISSGTCMLCWLYLYVIVLLFFCSHSAFQSSIPSISTLLPGHVEDNNAQSSISKRSSTSSEQSDRSLISLRSNETIQISGSNRLSTFSLNKLFARNENMPRRIENTIFTAFGLRVSIIILALI